MHRFISYKLSLEATGEAYLGRGGRLIGGGVTIIIGTTGQTECIIVVIAKDWKQR